VRVTFDAEKRQRAIEQRGPDFERAVEVFDGLTLEVEDNRHDYGEKRILCVGFLDRRVVMVGYTPRGTARHIFSMRRRNEWEVRRYTPYFEQGE